MENLTKVCTKCKAENPLSEYAKKASSANGMQAFCKECDRERNKIYRENNPEKEKERCRIKNLQYRKVDSKGKFKIESKIIEQLLPEITETSQSYLNVKSNLMEFKVVKISPELASSMLKNNESNRVISKNQIALLSSQMKGGTWKLNGETIKFSKSGRLLDGQHRLTAIINSGITIEIPVLYNLEEDVFATLDTGKKRSPGDVLTIQNVKYANVTAGAIRLILAYKNGLTLQNGGLMGKVATNQIVLDFENENNLSADAIQATSWYGKNRIITPAQFLFFHFILSEIDKNDCVDFLEKLSSGANLSERHPIKVLRDKILKHKNSSLSLPSNQLYHIIFKTWNYYREGREISLITLYKADDKPLVLK